MAALGQPTWLVHPLAGAQWLADLPGPYPPALLVAAGVLMALVGLIFLGNGLLPGRRARHVIANPRVAIVVDDEVIASALAKAPAWPQVSPANKSWWWSRRAWSRSTSGPHRASVCPNKPFKAAVEAQLAAMELDPRPAVTVKLAASGVIGV